MIFNIDSERFKELMRPGKVLSLLDKFPMKREEDYEMTHQVERKHLQLNSIQYYRVPNL